MNPHTERRSAEAADFRKPDMNKKDPLSWLSERSMPIWLRRGFDTRVGGFVENLSWEGEPLKGPRRCMVQARQIFSFRAALSLGAVNDETARAAVAGGVRTLSP